MRVMIHRIFVSRMYARIIIIFSVLYWFCYLTIPVLPNNVLAAENSPQATVITEPKLLEGTWVRPDGGYVLQLNNIADDGTLTAAYFNPRPIKIFQAFWATINRALRVSVELRDINYPGSKYNLQFDPGTDRLQGTYYQALERQTFAVEFVRQR